MWKVAILAAMLLTAGCAAMDRSKPPAPGAIRFPDILIGHCPTANATSRAANGTMAAMFHTPAFPLASPIPVSTSAARSPRDLDR
jgi:hypothetical protein